MKNHLRSTVAALGLGLMTAGALAPVVAFAQVFAPRQFTTQQVHYIRATLTFNMCTQVANACTFKIGAIPYNSSILRVNAVTQTAFNSTTSDGITLGTTAANANEIVNAACTIHAVAVVACTIALTGSSGTNQVGNGVAQTGANGGMDLFVKWTAGTGNTATAGLAALIIEYIAPNDGACTATPLGATPNGC